MIVDETLAALEEGLRADFDKTVRGFMVTARLKLEGALADVDQERAVVAKERGDLHREIEAMHKHTEAHKGHIELDIGGYRFETSVQTLRRIPHTFFDAYFSGRYAQDICNDESIFVDRDGEHFGHILEYMREGVVSVAEPGAHPSVSLLRTLQREFGFYCIELMVEKPVASEMSYAIGGSGNDNARSVARYDASSGLWTAVAAMNSTRQGFGACVVLGEIYVIGGNGSDCNALASVEKYSLALNSWSTTTSPPQGRLCHAAVAVGSAIYVLGGIIGADKVASTLMFDIAQGTGREVAPTPRARSEFASCVVGSAIYLFAGRDEDDEPQDSVFKYDTVTNEWCTLAPMPNISLDSMSLNASTVGDLIYVVGVGRAYKEVLCFDPASGVWSVSAPTLAVTHMLEGRYGFRTVTVTSANLSEERDFFDALIAKSRP
jgi:hypothetical protein